MLDQSSLKPLNYDSKFPNLVIVGAMKCGTSSLHQYLKLHPQIQMSQTKELDFFIQEARWNQGIEWYQAQFSQLENSGVTVKGESSPNYTKYPTFSGVPERMFHHIPDAKLIYVLRDPIQRIVSHYIHNFACRDESRSLEEVLDNLENNHYVNCSRYYLQLEQFLSYYPSNQILVVDLEELSSNTRLTLQSIFRFLNVDPNFKHEDFSEVFHRTSHKKRINDLGTKICKLPMGLRIIHLAPDLWLQEIEKPQLREDTQQRLVEVLKDDVEKLRAFTGQMFSTWSF